MYKGHEAIDVCRSGNNAMACLAPGSLSPDTLPSKLETNIDHSHPIHYRHHCKQQQHDSHHQLQHDSALRYIRCGIQIGHSASELKCNCSVLSYMLIVSSPNYRYHQLLIMNTLSASSASSAAAEWFSTLQHQMWEKPSFKGADRSLSSGSTLQHSHPHHWNHHQQHHQHRW